MSRSRLSVTPFHVEPSTSRVNDLRQDCEQHDRQRQKDFEKLDQLGKEMRDLYDGKSEGSREHVTRLFAMYTRVLENGKRLGTQRKDHMEAFQLLRSRMATSPNDCGSNSSGQAPSLEQSTDGTIPMATQQSTHTSRQNRPRGRNAGAPRSATRNSEPRASLYDDIMPRSGLRHLSDVETEKLGQRLLEQMNEIHNSRNSKVSPEDCRAVFGNRKPFRYRNKYYIARCPIHPNEYMDLKSVSSHFQKKHCVKKQRYVGRTAVKYLGTEITGTRSEVDRFVEMAQGLDERPYTMPVIPEIAARRRIVTLRSSFAIRAALGIGQAALQGTNDTGRDDTYTAATPENNVPSTRVESLSELTDAGGMSPLTESSTEDISREVVASPGSWSWTPTGREATPQHPETDEASGSDGDDSMVLDMEESGDSTGVVAAAAGAVTTGEAQTSSPAPANMPASPKNRLPRPGVRGLLLSPELFRSRTLDWAGSSNDAQERAVQHGEQQQQHTPAVDSAGTRGMASPPQPWRFTSEQQGNGSGQGLSAVEELRRIVHDNFAQHRFVLGACPE